MNNLLIEARICEVCSKIRGSFFTVVKERAKNPNESFYYYCPVCMSIQKFILTELPERYKVYEQP